MVYGPTFQDLGSRVLGVEGLRSTSSGPRVPKGHLYGDLGMVWQLRS